MSYSIALTGGDFHLSSNGASFEQAQQETKLIQDLRCYILESMGHDDMHPTFGSLLNGGIINGRSQKSMIGETLSAFSILEIRSEFQRIVESYRQSQVTRAKTDKSSFGRITLTRGEVLLQLLDVKIQQDQYEPTKLNVTLSIQTGNNSIVPLNIVFGT